MRFRQVDKNIFEDIRSGKKTVETRAATTKFRNIKSGDSVVFVCGSEKFEREVKSAKIFRSIPELLSEYDFRKVAPRLSGPEELEKMYYSFPGYREKIAKFGLIALEFA